MRSRQTSKCSISSHQRRQENNLESYFFHISERKGVAGGWPATWRRRRRRATRTCWRSLGQNIRCPCWCSSSRCRFGSAKSCPARVSCCTATTTLRSSIRCSVAWWTYGLFNLGHLQQWKFAQFHNKFAKVGSKICQILNKCSIFCLLGKISPYSITLIPWRNKSNSSTSGSMVSSSIDNLLTQVRCRDGQSKCFQCGKWPMGPRQKSVTVTSALKYQLALPVLLGTVATIHKSLVSAKLVKVVTLS